MSTRMSQQAINDAMNKIMSSAEVKAYAEIYVQKQQAHQSGQTLAEREFAEQLRAMQSKAMQNAAYQGQASAQNMGVGWAGPYNPAVSPPPPNSQNMQFNGVQTQNGINAAIPLDEESERANHAQSEALKAMNPLARFKYEALFRVLEIKVRFVPLGRSGAVGNQWILAKFVKGKGVPVRQEWSAPLKDPGCSLKTWEAMMSELMDEVARREGVDVTTDFDYRAESAGNETAGSAGNT